MIHEHAGSSSRGSALGVNAAVGRGLARSGFLAITIAAVAGFLALTGTTVTASGATMFTEDFSSNTAGPNMAVGTGFGSPTTSFASSNFKITSGTGSRVYLGTNDTDYSISSFVYEAHVTKPAYADTTNGAWGIIFFGMGSNVAGGAGVSGEPLTGSNLFMALRSDTGNIESRNNATTATGTVQGTFGVPFGTAATIGVRMTWDAVNKSAKFEFDRENDGIYTGPNDRNFTITNTTFNASNSRLVLGGGNGLIFDDISVVPEPSSLALVGLGAGNHAPPPPLAVMVPDSDAAGSFDAAAGPTRVVRAGILVSS